MCDCQSVHRNYYLQICVDLWKSGGISVYIMRGYHLYHWWCVQNLHWSLWWIISLCLPNNAFIDWLIYLANQITTRESQKLVIHIYGNNCGHWTAKSSTVLDIRICPHTYIHIRLLMYKVMHNHTCLYMWYLYIYMHA